MKLTKKFIVCVLALTLAFATAIPVFAQDVVISTSIAPTYTVTIPETTEIEFNAATTDFGAVTLTAAQINPGYYVKVAVTPNALANTADATKTIPYAVTDASGTAFTSAKYTTAGQATALKIAITQADWNAAFAGAYSGTVTFDISYTNE